MQKIFPILCQKKNEIIYLVLFIERFKKQSLVFIRFPPHFWALKNCHTSGTTTMLNFDFQTLLIMFPSIEKSLKLGSPASREIDLIVLKRQQNSGNRGDPSDLTLRPKMDWIDWLILCVKKKMYFTSLFILIWTLTLINVEI